MLISKEGNKRKVTALTGAMLSIGSIMAISSTKVNADTVRKANVEMQSSSVKNTIVTPAQNSLYQQNQKKSDNVEADKARAKVVEQQKQQAEKQNQQIQAQQNANNNQNNNGSNSNNNQANNNANQNVGGAQGDNAVKAFEQASQNSVNQQEQNSINQSHQAVAQQAKDRQAHYQQMLQKVASASTTLQAKPSNNNNLNNQAPTGSGSVYDQFIQAGGTPEVWKYIVMPESSGNPNAVNGKYHGIGQTDQQWGFGSVANQTKGMMNYINSRYGSVSNAIAFRQAHGWY